jgi:drug/metabolite transporter (DMT)-like permease
MTWFTAVFLYLAYALIGGWYPVLLREAWKAPGPLARPQIWFLAGGIAFAAINFFVFLAILERNPASIAFALASGLIMVSATVVAIIRYREEMDWRRWLGVLLISAGIALVHIGG